MELQKTIKDDKLGSLVSSIVKRIVKKTQKTKIKDEINKRYEDLEKRYNMRWVIKKIIFQLSWLFSQLSLCPC